MGIIKNSKNSKANNICLYEKQLNSLYLKFQSLKASFEKIIDIIKPFMDYKRNYTLEEVVENSLLNERTKKSTMSLINKYKDYC